MKRSVILVLALVALALPACSGGEEATEEMPAPAETAPAPEPAAEEPAVEPAPTDTMVVPDTAAAPTDAVTGDVNT